MHAVNVNLLIGLAEAALAARQWAPQAHFYVPPLAATRTGSAICPHVFVPLFAAQQPLSSLARDGAYTVVEVYINPGASCKQFEGQLPAFLVHRNDVVVRRVHGWRSKTRAPDRVAALAGYSWPRDYRIVPPCT